jgi:anti-sigma factor RsiW
VEQDLPLYLLQDLSEKERGEIEEHLKSCSACSAALASSQGLLSALSERPVAAPPPVLLNSCRDALQETLDTVRPNGYSRIRWLLSTLNPSGWILAHPAWGAALLIVLGVSLGYAAPAILNSLAQETEAAPLVTVRPVMDLQNVDDMHVSFVPSTNQPNGSVVVQLVKGVPVEFSGSADDPDVRNALLYALRNSNRVDLDVRLGSIEVLRGHTTDPQIRDALVFAARNDSSAGVRLKAIEGLRGQEQDERVRQALLDAVVHDPNQGVRIEAVTALRMLADSHPGIPFGDERIIQVLRERALRDPNTYVRLQSAAVVRQVEPRQTH